ncbi:MAG: chlorohydrolase [Nitratiruptor sp.]|nr:chlorohydrolase [Nitratiruptor sp.]NPA82875.1 metal-dependent hydrolase [Campylobacterota bacterium]
MEILKASYLLTPEEILQGVDLAIDGGRIVEIGPNLQERYPKATLHHYPGRAILPGFCNPHLHLEFSANRATLSYGDFIVWLESVIRHRERLIPRCDEACLEWAIEEILSSGTTTIGAISSYGGDLEAAVRSGLNVAYFSEIIGSNPGAADILYSDFLHRYYRAKKYEGERFRACVAIHSPYAVHYVLAKKALELARKEETLVSLHFMESRAEREWLDSDSGDFRQFFEKFLNQRKAANRPLEFLQLFHDLQTLVVHSVWANDAELDLIAQEGHAIVHCPRSNRLLGNGVLDLDRLKARAIPYSIATDGLSSNYSLNMYDELRAALFLHPDYPALSFAKELLVQATTWAKRLGFASGTLEAGNFADLQIVQIPEDLEVVEELYLHLILHTHKPEVVYLQGVRHGK